MSKERQTGGRASSASPFPLASHFSSPSPEETHKKSRAMEQLPRTTTHAQPQTPPKGTSIRRAAKPFIVSKTATRPFLASKNRYRAVSTRRATNSTVRLGGGKELKSPSVKKGKVLPNDGRPYSAARTYEAGEKAVACKKSRYKTVSYGE